MAEVAPPRWVKVLDQDRCIGCHACTTACKSENEVPLGVTRTYVKAVEVGTFPQVRRNFQVTRCNQCSDAWIARHELTEPVLGHIARFWRSRAEATLVALRNPWAGAAETETVGGPT
jgi:ferredoxin